MITYSCSSPDIEDGYIDFFSSSCYSYSPPSYTGYDKLGIGLLILLISYCYSSSCCDEEYWANPNNPPRIIASYLLLYGSLCSSYYCIPRLARIASCNGIIDFSMFL